MNINWKEVKEKYPKSYKNLFTHYKKNNPNCIELCYCDIEKFFDDNYLEITIEITFIHNRKYWYNKIYFGNIYDKSHLQFSRDGAKEIAIYRAFEILEIKLNETN